MGGAAQTVRRSCAGAPLAAKDKGGCLPTHQVCLELSGGLCAHPRNSRGSPMDHQTGALWRIGLDFACFHHLSGLSMLTLHHLEMSRSSRIIWLLEALGLEYELVVHKRGPDRRSPASLAAIHPLAKAPALVDGDLILTESSAVLRHIAERYGDGRFTPPLGTDAHSKHSEWLDYTESSMMGPLMVKLTSMMGGGLPEGADRFFSGELARALDHISEGVGSGPFLMGDQLTLADLQLSYSMALLEVVGMLAGRPALAGYWARLQADPGYKRMLGVGGPLMMGRG